MDDTSPPTRTRYPIHRLMIDGEWVIDTWLFSHDKQPALLYTPDALDGVAFREARLFNYLLKQTDGLIEYLTVRVGVQAQKRVRTFLETAKRTCHRRSTEPRQVQPGMTRRRRWIRSRICVMSCMT
ncbi:hypothetical protein LJJ44_01560 [Pseudomonas sp. B24_DOA]|nr:hypothetical protein LJJ44_01560 [Pseudomonas sp. B24_DOA]